jgi:hypothetical protein
MNANEYKCQACGGVFEKGWSDEEAAAELGETFPDFAPIDCGLVCDDCWQKHFAPAQGMAPEGRGREGGPGSSELPSPVVADDAPKGESS